MDGFLRGVAADLYDRYGDGVSSLSIVFPSRRASLFFGEELSRLVSKPLWQPSSITVDTLAEELSGLSTGSRLRLVVELYKIYAEFHPAESFDSFYFWGELLLGDFDSIDKYLIDADALFSNLIDLHELDDRFDYLSALSPEQRSAIERFWGTLSEHASDEQRDFLAVWRTLGPVYHRFRERLPELGIAYSGMVYREAAERIRDGRAPQIPERHYVIAGFNALGRCEQEIFDYLRQNFEVDFYWDYDNYYTGDDPLALAQEAGRFMRDNLRRFPPTCRFRGGHDNFIKPKTIRSIAAASDVLQCKYAGLRLGEIARQSASGRVDKNTAVVLCDEGLLVPLLWSMPSEVDKINITMGFPLRMHPAYTFVERLVELQNRRRTAPSSLAFYHSDVEGLLRHPYLKGLVPPKSRYVYINAERLRTSPLYEKIFSAPGIDDAHEGWRQMSDYLIDVISQVAGNATGSETNGTQGSNADGADAAVAIAVFAIIVEHIRTLANSLEGCGVELSSKTYASLLRRSLQSVTVPFEGEPLEGVQVMGILETRALDFENIIFLSAGDSNLPGNLVGAPSFIPYNLKMAFGLPTPEHHEGVYAYHFFRLIQRARRVDMVWSSTSDERSAGEPSRYILQLDYESPHTVDKESITVDVNLPAKESIVVGKEPEKIPRRLSPSLFFTYSECPLKFYFRAVAHLRVDEEVAEEVDNALFGSILHRAMQLLYSPLVGLRDPRPGIQALKGSGEVEKAVSQAMGELYLREEKTGGPETLSGDATLVHRTIVEYIDRGILPFDARRTESYTIERLEEKLSVEFDGVCFAGIADRIDRLKDGTLQIIDYKTGSSKNNASALLQMGLYAMMLAQKEGADNVRPVLYYVRDMLRSGYTPSVVEQEEDFEQNLRATLAELFDPEVPFTWCSDPKPCAWCDYNAICRR